MAMVVRMSRAGLVSSRPLQQVMAVVVPLPDTWGFVAGLVSNLRAGDKLSMTPCNRLGWGFTSWIRS